MENTIYIGLSRQMALSNNMDIVANNIANINTPGYRGQNLLFKEFLSNPKGTDAPESYVEDIGQYQATEPGPTQFTGNPLDVSVAGPGFIGVIGPDGKIGYTRAGDFQLSPDGSLKTASGFPVADNGGAPIKLPADSSEIHIAQDGVISNQSGQVGQIKLVEFENLQQLSPMGNGLYKTDAATKPASHSTLMQGQLEGSNVKPVIEMTRMIDTLRAFQNVQQILQTENDRLRSAIEHMTRA
jgi:flagellar basal-body rod protein FlgF